MPKTSITYRIFIAAPSDIIEEKDIIWQVAEELNNSPLVKNIKLEVIDWKSFIHPDIGDDGQDVINTQINDEYDIFLGLFWSRFGSPTKRDTSGTKEEFERAYARHSEDKESVHILMYFKKAPISIDDIDPEQISHIKKFQEDISKRGVLFGTFSQSVEFEGIIRSHLSKLISEISNKIEHNTKDSSNSFRSKHDEQQSDVIEEKGYLEYLDGTTSNISKLVPELHKLSKEIGDLSSRMTKRTEKIISIRSSRMPQDMIAKESRKVINESSNDLDIFNKKVNPLVPRLNELFNNSITNYNNAILIQKDYFNDKSQLLNSINSLHTLRGQVYTASQSSFIFYTSIKGLPPMTTKFLKSRNETIKVLKQVSDEFLSYINIIDNVIAVVSN